MAYRLDVDDLRALFEHVLDGVLFTHPDGRILAANPAACALLRATEAQVCAAGRIALVDATDPRWPLLLAERAQRAALVDLASRDALTGVANRGAFTTALVVDVHEGHSDPAARHRRPCRGRRVRHLAPGRAWTG